MFSRDIKKMDKAKKAILGKNWHQSKEGRKCKSFGGDD